jgi:uncharacterized protein (TIGR02246 family)
MTADLSPGEQAIRQLEQQLAAAWVKGDRAFIEQLIAEDWTVIDQSGNILSKRQLIDETFAATDRRIDAMEIDDVRVRLLGDVAVATGRTRVSGRYKGQPVGVTLRFTDVFHFRDGRWQAVASHGTLVG